jgi:hypothetical protein
VRRASIYSLIMVVVARALLPFMLFNASSMLEVLHDNNCFNHDLFSEINHEIV